MEIFVLIFLFTAIIVMPVISFIINIKKMNKEDRDPCVRYKRIKRRIELRHQIFEALVNNHYTVNHLHWYTFTLNESGETYTMGIVEVLGAFGDNVFKDADREKSRRKEIKEEFELKQNELFVGL